MGGWEGGDRLDGGVNSYPFYCEIETNFGIKNFIKYHSFCSNIFLLLACDNIFIVEEHLFLERTCFLNELSVFLLENIFITFLDA